VRAIVRRSGRCGFSRLEPARIGRFTQQCPIRNGCPNATTQGANQNFTGGLAQMLARRGIRGNGVAPGPVRTPPDPRRTLVDPSRMPPEAVARFEQVPMKRPAQPKELAPVLVLLASDEASYISGATVGVTDGTPVI
jgi:NAD(P)-dependent dehydrogenase (short-subunit alcohol dehydrogenase family)